MMKIFDWLASLSDDNRNYALKNLPIHMAQAGHNNKLFRFLTDFDFIEAKLYDLTPQVLIEDYDLALAPEILISDEKKDCLKVIQGAIRLSAHILDRNNTQLAGQLLGRLLSHESPEIQAMLEQAKQWHSNPWLRPLIASLTPPGGSLLCTLTGHTAEVTAVAVTPDGRCAISASKDKTLKIWALDTGVELFTLVGHDDWVTAVAVTPDGQCAISASDSLEQKLKLWNLESRVELLVLQGHTGSIHAVAVTPDSKRVVSASADKTLKVWDLSSGKELFTLNNHTGEIYAVAVTPDGQRAISASLDNTLKLWDLKSGSELQTLHGHSTAVTSVAIISDGKRAISASADKTLKIWDLESKPEQVSLSRRENRNIPVSEMLDEQLSILASQDKMFNVCDLGNEIEPRNIYDHTDYIKNLRINEILLLKALLSDFNTALAMTPDRRVFVYASQDATLQVWDLKSGRKLRTLDGHTDFITAVAVTPDGRVAVSASRDATLKLWDLESGIVLASFNGDGWFCACAFAQDGMIIIASDIFKQTHFLRIEGV